MNTINSLLINIILLLFPLIVNLFYFAHSSNVDKNRSNAFLDFSLLSSLYLFYSHYKIGLNFDFIILLNIPLIISYIKKRSLTSIIISFLIICIYKVNTNISLVILIIEYVIDYLLYLKTDKLKNNKFFVMFLEIKVIFYILNLFYLNDFDLIKSFLTISIFIVTSNLILYLFKMGEDIIKLHMTIKELEKEKQIRESLFKITHEIKNPIAVCKTYLDMFDFDNKEHKKFIPVIKEEIQNTLLLLQDFLCMSKIKIQKEILDINLLLEDIIYQFESVMKSNNIKFNYDISLDEVFVEGDYNRLSQVFINIIKNSIEASDENKESYVSVSTQVSNSKIKIIIKDNGLGINKEELSRIKEPFYTTKKNGTGLGVSLSSEIINAHSGSIEYTSLENEWTKVEIILPIYEIN